MTFNAFGGVDISSVFNYPIAPVRTLYVELLKHHGVVNHTQVEGNEVLIYFSSDRRHSERIVLRPSKMGPRVRRRTDRHKWMRSGKGTK